MNDTCEYWAGAAILRRFSSSVDTVFRVNLHGEEEAPIFHPTVCVAERRGKPLD